MGISESKPSHRVSKEERKKREEIKTNMVNRRIGEIEEFQESVFQSVNSNSLTTQNGIDMLNISQTVKTQVQRGGNTLTKTDLITIIMILSDKNSIHQLQSLTVNDLNTIIRNIIYDPKRLMQSKPVLNSTNTVQHKQIIF